MEGSKGELEIFLTNSSHVFSWNLGWVAGCCTWVSWLSRDELLVESKLVQKRRREKEKRVLGGGKEVELEIEPPLSCSLSSLVVTLSLLKCFLVSSL